MASVVASLSAMAGTSAPADTLSVGYGRTAARDLSSAVSTIGGESVTARSSAFDVLQGIAGQAAGLNIISGSGMPGVLGHATVRGTGSFSSSTSPLFVVDGAVGVDPALISAADIESIQVLKDAAATAIYGSLGGNGVIIVNTKRGEGEGTVTLSTGTGAGFLSQAPELKDKDWYKECTRSSALVTNNNVTFTKGGTTSVYANVGYQNNQGLVNSTDANRLSGTLNLDSRINSWFDVKASASGVLTNVSKGAWESYSLGAYTDSPVADVDAREDKTRTVRANFNLINNIHILKNLTLTVTGNYQTINDVNNVTAGEGVKDTDSEAPFAKVFNAKTNRWSNEDYLTYSGAFADGRLRSEFMAGFSVSSLLYEDSSTGTHNLPTDYYGYHNLGLGTSYAPTSSKIADKTYSGYFRTSQVWKDKYILGFTVRTDKSSVFGNSYDAQVYPSVSAAWNISEESFFEGVKSAVSMLKLRASYGKTGNRSFASAILWDPKNFDLKPERSLQVNVGLDLAFAKNRVNASVDWYMKDNRGLILEHANVWENCGVVVNKGVEITINARTIAHDNFKWNTDLAFSYYDTIVSDLGGASCGNAIFSAAKDEVYPAFFLATASGEDFCGQAAPKFEASLVNTFGIGGFDILLDINSMLGHKAYLLPYGFSSGRGTDANLSKASFARLRTLSLSYNFKHSLLKNCKFIKGLRFGVTGENLFVATSYDGNDPEVFSTVGTLSGLGVDCGAYPKPAVVTGNLRITF